MRKKLLPIAMLAGLAGAAGPAALNYAGGGPCVPGPDPKRGKDKNSGANRVSQKKRRINARRGGDKCKR